MHTTLGGRPGERRAHEGRFIDGIYDGTMMSDGGAQVRIDSG